jgi:hypothetical protein
MSYSTVSMGVRPPRVVILFDGGDRWTYWARRALHLAGQVWGGCGFAVVPHRSGRVDRVLLRACRAYDPDFVVTFPRLVGELEQLRPGWFQVRGKDGQLLTGREREEMLAPVKTQEVHERADGVARNVVADVCSPYRIRLDAETWDEDVIILHGAGNRHFHDALAVPGAHHGPVLACPSHWGGLSGVAIASHAGIVEAPEFAAAEPELTEQVLHHLTHWLLGVRDAAAPDELVWCPNVAMSVDPKTTFVGHQRTMTSLVLVSSGTPHRRTGLAVLGDEPEDFALARLWQLTFGVGVWLPSTLGGDQDEPPYALTTGLAEVAHGLARRTGTLALTSLSRSAEQVAQAHGRICKAMEATEPEADDPTERVSILASTELPWKQPLSAHLAIAEQFDSYVTVPTVVDESGTRSMAAPLPAPILSQPNLAAHPDLTWHVDVSWRPSQAVGGRGLDGQEVFTPDTERWLTWGRCSRNGISYQSHRFNFVLAGIPAVNKLARPALRDLSLAAWVAAKGREHQLDVRPSHVGHRTALLGRMLGDREQFVHLFGGPLLPALKSLLPVSPESRDAYPKQDGVVLAAGEGVLTFAGFCARAPELESEHVRDRLDAALRAGVLRRGLVLQCQTCEQKQFQVIGKVDQVWTCVRCDAAGDLSRRAWKKPDDEPIWFYDLHPVGRQLLRDHGEVAALLSAFLSSGQKDGPSHFRDVEEVEFINDGKPQAEVDLIAYTDDTLIVAECKSSDHLSEDAAKAREDVRKKCQAAAWLKADRLIFATTAASWTKRTFGQLQHGIGEFAWGPLGPPEVRLIVGLAATPQETILVVPEVSASRAGAVST